MDYSDQVFHRLIGGSGRLVPVSPRFEGLAHDFRCGKLLALRYAGNALTGFFVEPKGQRGSHDVTSSSISVYYAV